MSNRCGYNGTATVQEHRPGGWESEPTYGWLQADPLIHVASELVDDPHASAQIALKYDIGSWCDEVQAFHATLIEDAT